MRRRSPAVATLLVVLASGCADTPRGSPSAAPSTTGVSTPAPGDPSLLGPDPAASPPAALLIAGPDGVTEVAPTGETRTLVQGPVAFAVDDTTGGLVYQVGRGRPYGDPSHPSTALIWQRAGGAAPTALAEPHPGTFFALHDALATPGGAVEVFATRASGSNPEDWLDTVVAFDPVSGSARDIRDVGGWEYGTEPVTVTPTLLGGSYSAEALIGMDFFDQRGNPVDIGGNPLPEPTHDCSCPRLAELSPDAATLAYLEMGDDGQGFFIIPEVVLVDAGSGEELRRLRLDRPDQGWMPISFDLGDGVLVVNRSVTGEFDAPVDAAWVIDLREPEPVVWQAPVSGRAHLVRAPVAL
jgi:hypothetical protein